MSILKKHMPAILRCVTVVGVMIIALDLFGLAWPYQLAIGLVVLFIVFSFTGVWDDENKLPNDRS